MEKGIRIIPTFRCSANCKFCYQSRLRDSDILLPVDKMESILLESHCQSYDYITFMGGEVTEIPSFDRYVGVVKKIFSGRINLTTNGLASTGTYVDLAIAGVNHFNFSTVYKLKEKIHWLRHSASMRLNVFLPDIEDGVLTEYDRNCLETIQKGYQIVGDSDLQMNILYDYRVPIEDYDSTVRKMEGLAKKYIDENLVIKHVGVNFIIMEAHGRETWFDINYKKQQELVIAPDGQIDRGFHYMERFNDTL